MSTLWLAAIALPVALVIQGIGLGRRATTELFDALRARRQTPELEQITPVFARYRAQATGLIEALRAANWVS